MRGVITRRNLLAATIQRRRQTLEEGALRGPIYPPKIDQPPGREHYQCRSCFSRNACYTVSTALEGGQEMVATMAAETRAYVQKWMMVID